MNKRRKKKKRYKIKNILMLVIIIFLIIKLFSVLINSGKDNKDEIVKQRMNKIAKCVDGLLPINYGFIVLAFGFKNEGKELIYASNANREDVVKVMKEFITKTEENYGNDTGKY